VKRLLPLIMLGLLFASCTSSKRLSYLIEPEINPNQAKKIDVAKYDSLYAGYDGVYLYDESTIEHSGIKESASQGLGSLLGGLVGSITKEWTFSRIEKTEYVILNPNNRYLTTVSIGWKPDKLYVHVTNPDGTIRRYDMTSFAEETDPEGRKMYRLALPNIVKGSIVEKAWEEAYQINYRLPSLEHDIDLQFRIPCESLVVTYAYPDWWQIQVKKVAKGKTAGYRLVEDPEHKKKILSYSTADVPAVADEPYSPFFKELANYLEFQVTDLAMKGYTYKSTSSWDKFAERFRKYALKKSGKGKDQLEEKARALAENCTTPLEKIDAVRQYINDSISMWSGDYDGNYPKVMKEGKGNPFEITGLAQALLEHMGFLPEYFLMHSAEDGYFDATYVSASQAYMPGLGIKVDSTLYVLLPYLKNLPINLVPEQYQGQPAIVISEPVARQVTIPIGNHAENTQSELYDLSIGADGVVHVKETRKALGSVAYGLRETLADLRDDELRDTLKSFLTYSDGDVTLDSFRVDNMDAYQEPLVLEMQYTIDNLVTITPEEILFQTGGLLSPISNKQEKINPATRQNPIAIYNDQAYEKEITIRYPEAWQPSTVLADTTIENSFGSVTRSFAVDDDGVKIIQKVMLNKCFEPKERMNDLAQLISSKSLLDVPALVFKPREFGSTE